MIYQRTIPVGLDIKINAIQAKLERVFVTLLSTGQFDIYGRIYRLKEDTGIKPVKFISGEFNRVLFTTDKFLVSYFYERTDVSYSNGIYSVTLGNIYHANLSALFPSITSRADQEFTKILSDVFKIEPYGFKQLDYVTGIDRVFSDFSYDSTIEDIHPYFTARVDLNINFRI